MAWALRSTRIAMTKGACSMFSLAVVTMLAACGGKDRSQATPSRDGAAAPTRSPQGDPLLRLSCNQSWVPNRRTLADRHWRRRSVRMGPVTFMLMRSAAHMPAARYGSIKFRTLVEPNSPVRISIGEDARRDVG